MHVRILGPLEVEDEKAPVALGGQRQRALLAVLVLARGSVVSSDRLIDGLWEEEAPATARNVVQGHVSQLRKAFGGNGRLETRGHGYVLHLEQGELDVDQFEELFADGRRLLTEDDPAAASGALLEALALWRGPALADFAYEPFASAEAARLEDRRLACLEERIEADLALGRQVDLVPELEGLVRDHPLRERFRGQLMLALYRAGRQAEALDAYQDARRALVDELGIEPGPALQELERQILNQDPGLAPPARVEPPAAPAAESRRRRGWLLLVAGLVVLAGAVGAGIWQLTRPDAPQIDIVAGNAVAAIDPATNRLIAQIPVGLSPTAVAVGEGSVWVLNADAQTISRIDPETKRTETFATGTTPTELAAGEGAVWIGNGAEQRASAESASAWSTWSVSRVDPGTGIAGEPVELSAAPGVDIYAYRTPGQNRLAVGGGSAWVVNPDRTVSRIDAATGAVTATFDVHASALTFGEGALWLLADGRVLRISPRTNRITASIDTGSGGDAIAVGGGAVWVTDPYAETLWRIDPGPQSRVRGIRIGPGIGGVAYGEGAVWVVSPIEGTVTRVDPASNRVVGTIATGNTPRGVAAGYGAVWVAVGGTSESAVPAVDSQPAAAADVLPASMCGPLFYGGAQPGPDLVIVSDLPLRGGASAYAASMPDAIRLVLRDSGFRAGRHTVGYQSCDDSTAQSGGQWDFDKCASNAKAYGQNPSVAGVIGPQDSPCAFVQIPIANRAPDGPLAMISPSNSYPGLTRAAPFVPAGQLDELYPTGTRNYVRIFPADHAQAAALAVLADELALESVYLLHDGPEYGQAMATMFRKAAGSLGLEIAGSRRWDPDAEGYGDLAGRIRRSGAEGVLVAGFTQSNTGPLLKDLRAGLADGTVLMAPDSFAAAELVISLAGDAATGLYVAYPGLPDTELDDAGKQFVADLAATQPDGIVPWFSGTYAAQSAEVLLDAIARSDGTRASITDELLRTQITDGLLGDFGFDENGDITAPAVTILRLVEEDEPGEPFSHTSFDRVIRPPAELLR